MKTLDDALTMKYGEPFERRGHVNAFRPSSEPWFKDYPHGHKCIEYLEKSRWLNNELGMSIELKNFRSVDTNMVFNEVKLLVVSSIEVLFNISIVQKVDLLMNIAVAKDELRLKKQEEDQRKRKDKQIEDL